MLDEVGITLQEVNKKYPSSIQVLGYDVCMDYDTAFKPKVISTFEMCINIIMTLLFMKPGQYPSIPDIGIDIESYLFEYSDDSTLKTMKTECDTMFANWVGSLVDELTIEFERGINTDGGDIVICKVRVVFRGLVIRHRGSVDTQILPIDASHRPSLLCSAVWSFGLDAFLLFILSRTLLRIGPTTQTESPYT